MKSRTLSLLGTGLAVLWLVAACVPGNAATGAPTPLPIVSDLGGVRAEGRLEPIRYVELAPVVTGVVSNVPVTEGQVVQAGDLIARLDTIEGETLETAQNRAGIELAEAHEALRLATDRLDEYPLPRVFEGLTAEQATRTWLAELDAAREAFEPYKDTSRKALKPRHVLNEWVYPSMPRRVLVDTYDYDEMAMVYKKRLDVAWMNYRKAVLWLDLDSAVAAAQARVDEAQRRLDLLKSDSAAAGSAGTRAALATAEIRAPFTGTITRMDLETGEVITAGTSVVTLADLSSWIVKTTDLTEIDVTSIQEGMPAAITFDAMTDNQIPGNVAWIDLSYADRQGDILYPVNVAMGENPSWLRWGMTAEITFGN